MRSFPILVTIIWGVLLLPGLLGAALSVMFFDAPGSMNNPAAWLNAGITTSGPHIVVACLPLLPVAYFGVVLVAETAGVLFSGQPLGLHSTIIHH